MIDKNQVANFLSVTGRWLARWKTPLRPLILWLWKKTARRFLED